MRLRLPHDAWVIVCDAHKALFLRNDGDEVFPNLRVERTREAPPESVDGIERPGRIQNVFGPTSAVDVSNLGAVAEADFAAATVEAILRLNEWDNPPAIILVAPPPMLAALRKCLHRHPPIPIAAEIGKDLTKHPVNEIERLLTAA